MTWFWDYAPNFFILLLTWFIFSMRFFELGLLFAALKKMVGTSGFEPPTPRTPSVCATRLRHVPTRKSYYNKSGRIFYIFSDFLSSDEAIS